MPEAGGLESESQSLHPQDPKTGLSLEGLGFRGQGWLPLSCSYDTGLSKGLRFRVEGCANGTDPDMGVVGIWSKKTANPIFLPEHVHIQRMLTH